MKELIFCLLLFLSTVICAPQIHAQQLDTNSRPFLVPFQVDGQWAMMDTLGREVKAPGFCKAIYFQGDFSYYVIMGKADAARYWLMDSRSGDRIDLGELKAGDPVLKIGGVWFYHFEKDNKTVLASPVTMESFTLDDQYRRVESMELYDLKGENRRSYLLAFDDDYIGSILSVDHHFKKAARVPPFKKIDLINTTVKEDYYMKTFPIGFAVETIKKEEDAVALEEGVPPPPELAEYPDLSNYKKGQPLPKIKPPAPRPISPPEPVSLKLQDDSKAATSEIFDFQLTDKGTLPVNDSLLTAAFGVKTVLQGNRPTAVAMGGGIIKNGIGNDQSVELNQEFAIKRITKKVSQSTYRQDYYLVQKHDDQTFTELVSDDDVQFDWVRHRGDKLISIRFRGDDNSLTAYFDYNGIALPKNKLMVPSKYYRGEAMKPFLFQ